MPQSQALPSDLVVADGNKLHERERVLATGSPKESIDCSRGHASPGSCQQTDDVVTPELPISPGVSNSQSPEQSTHEDTSDETQSPDGSTVWSATPSAQANSPEPMPMIDEISYALMVYLYSEYQECPPHGVRSVPSGTASSSSPAEGTKISTASYTSQAGPSRKRPRVPNDSGDGSRRKGKRRSGGPPDWHDIKHLACPFYLRYPEDPTYAPDGDLSRCKAGIMPGRLKSVPMSCFIASAC